LFVVNDSEVGLSAVSLRSPWMGCRIGVVTRAMAIEFGHEVPTGFEKGFLDPCHGGLFSLDGQHLAGPGHRSLITFHVKYLPDGTVVVDLTAVRVGGGTPLRFVGAV
jgi:Rieske Fe-S protein